MSSPAIFTGTTHSTRLSLRYLHPHRHIQSRHQLVSRGDRSLCTFPTSLRQPEGLKGDSTPTKEHEAVASDEARQGAFEKHKRRLKEKEEEAERDRQRRRDRDDHHRDGGDRPHRNGGRLGRSRTPETNPYEADRRRTIAERERERERNHRKSSMAESLLSLTESRPTDGTTCTKRRRTIFHLLLKRASRTPETNPDEADRRKAIAERERNYRKSTTMFLSRLVVTTYEDGDILADVEVTETGETEVSVLDLDRLSAHPLSPSGFPRAQSSALLLLR